MPPSDLTSVADLFAAAAARAPDSDFLHVPHAAAATYASAPVTLTYAAAAKRIEALAATYRECGYGRGHRVALALDNRCEFFLHFLALNSLGSSIVPINAAMSRDEIAYVLQHSDASLAIAHEGHLRLMRAALPPACTLAEECLGSVTAPPPPRRAGAACSGEVSLLYTSGTTGSPKGCVLDEHYFAQIASHYAGIGGYCLFEAGRDRLITPLPVTHMNALACSFLVMLKVGGCLVQLDRFHPSSWWESVRASRATCFHYLGVMPAMLLRAPPGDLDAVGRQLRFGFGAGVDPRHHAAFEARFGVPLIEAWAMTETGGAGWVTASHEPRHVGQRCFGRAPEGLAYRIVSEGGEDVPAGRTGELLVRNAGEEPRRGFFTAYYKDPEATEAAWAGGWFHTGDAVRQGEDGSLYFVDRLKNVIRRSGENIAAVEVESALMQASGVAACAVTAVPDDLRGEEVFAFVVASEGGACGMQAATMLQAECLRRLAYYKAPGFLAFVAQIPQTASQKLARGKLRSMAVESLAAGQAIDLRQYKKRPITAGSAAGV